MKVISNYILVGILDIFCNFIYLKVIVYMYFVRGFSEIKIKGWVVENEVKRIVLGVIKEIKS